MQLAGVKDPNDQRFVGLEEIFETLKGHIAALDTLLEKEVEGFEPELRELAAYALGHRGKRLRPMLAFFCGWKGSDVVDPNVVRIAAIMEMVHLATLVHDDILDNAALRHNTSTVHTQYGQKQAILLGDALFAHALKLAAEFDTVEICRTVSNGVRRVCAGEVTQTLCESKGDYDYHKYFRVIDLKTAELFAISAFLGAKVSGAEQDFVYAAESFARNLGMAYQIFDDLADIVGSEKKIGKTLGTDMESGKYTLPILLLIDELGPDEGKKLIEAVKKDTAKELRVRKMLEEKGILQKVKTVFDEKISDAESIVKPYTEHEGVKFLIVLKCLVCKQMDKLVLS